MKFSIEAGAKNFKAEITGKGDEIIAGIMTVMDHDERLARIFKRAVEEHEEAKFESGLRISASEALYGFIGWLSTRKEKVVLSSSSDASQAAELVNTFIKAQGLSNPRDGHYPENIARMNDKGESECRNCGEIHD